MRAKARASHCLRGFRQGKTCSGAVSSVTEVLSLPWGLSLFFSFVCCVAVLKGCIACSGKKTI